MYTQNCEHAQRTLRRRQISQARATRRCRFLSLERPGLLSAESSSEDMMAVVAGGKVVSGAARTRMRQGISPFRSRQVVVAHFTSWVQLSDQALTIGCMTRSSLMEFFHHRPSSFSLLVYAAYTAGANDSNIGISDHPNLYRRSQLPSCSIIRCDDALPRRRSVWPPPLAPHARQYGGSFTTEHRRKLPGSRFSL